MHKAGTLLQFSRGDYGDYGTCGLFNILMDFDIDKELNAWLTEEGIDPDQDFDSLDLPLEVYTQMRNIKKGFISVLIDKGYLVEQKYISEHFSDVLPL